MKMSDYDTGRDRTERSESDSKKNKEEPSKMKFESAKRALRSANEKLCQSTRQKNPVVRYRYNEYMAHHYAYITLVVEVREPESYVEAAKDAN